MKRRYFLVQIGKIINTHGHKGEVKVYPLTDFPQRYQLLKEVFLLTSSLEPKSLFIEMVRFHKGCIILKIKGCDSINQAEELKGGILAIPEEQVMPLKVDEYYYFQIMGLEVYTVDGVHLGVVADIFPTGSNDVYTVRKGDREYLIPAIKEVIKQIDVKVGRMVIQPMTGLLDPDDAF